MATVTKPIALDESLNTTELSSRNVADVLAQELSAVATAIGGIAVPSADHVSYDNSVSGLSATDVQNALDEIVSDIPTVNNGTLTIQQNGTSKGSFTANSASNVNVNIETPTADKKTATDQFTTADGGLLSKCQINLVPVQSGSGDPSPDNVRPISGHTEVDLQTVGRNWFNKDNYKFVKNSYIDGNNAWVGNTTILTYPDDALSNYWNSVLIDLTPYSGKAITYSGFASQNGTYRGLLDENFNVLATLGNSSVASGTADLSQYPTAKYLALAFIKSSYNFDSAQLEVGSTVTSYEPYLGHLYQVQIGSTVYGGYVDLVSGVMVATHASETITSMEYYGTYGVDNAPLFYKDLTNTYVQYGSATAPIANKPISNAYRAISVNDATQLKNNEFRTQQVDTPNRYYFRDDRYNSKAQMDAWLSDNPVQVCGKLATPLTINLTPQQIETLAGQNNLSTPLDGQSIETNGVEYKELFTFADVKEYVDKKIPDAPTTDGTYTLQAVVSSGAPTYSWT